MVGFIGPKIAKNKNRRQACKELAELMYVGITN